MRQSVLSDGERFKGGAKRDSSQTPPRPWVEQELCEENFPSNFGLDPLFFPERVPTTQLLRLAGLHSSLKNNRGDLFLACPTVALRDTPIHMLHRAGRVAPAYSNGQSFGGCMALKRCA